MVRFPYTVANTPNANPMPWLTLVLSLDELNQQVTCLLDTGASINVMPYNVGISLGAVWQEQTTSVPLAGSLGSIEARALLVMASHPQITYNAPVKQAFAWTASDDVPLILGQTNFFMEFDVCFYRGKNVFDVQLRRRGG